MVDKETLIICRKQNQKFSSIWLTKLNAKIFKFLLVKIIIIVILAKWFETPKMNHVDVAMMILIGPYKALIIDIVADENIPTICAKHTEEISLFSMPLFIGSPPKCS